MKVNVADTIPDERDAVAAADVVLSAALALGSGVVKLVPRRDGTYSVRCESDRETITASTLHGRLGTAAVLRLATIAGLDPSSPEPQVGRVRIRCGDALADIVVCSSTEPPLGPTAELLVLGRQRSADLPYAAAAPTELEPGTNVGPYRVVELIGFGGMGAVYRIEHRELRRMFAMKVMRPELLEQPDAVELFAREARTVARIRHRSVVDVSDCGRLDDGRPYLVMELLSGTSLLDVLRDRGAARPEQVLELLRESARALQAAHASGVVHQDISTANLIVESENDSAQVKLIDFGASAVLDVGDRSLPPQETFFGTPFYVSPERVRGAAVDARSDIYSLGIVFYELLTAEVPFSGNTAQEVLFQHLRRSPPPPRSPHGKVPRGMLRILDRMLAKDPADRYQSLDELIHDIDRQNAKTRVSLWRKLVPGTSPYS